MSRAHNFSAGPAVLPLPVLEKAQEELLNYQGCGSSIMEVSHRGKEYTEVDSHARSLLKELLGLGEDHEVLFLQGGASTQFLMAPYNFLSTGQTADYLNTGAWSTKAIKEAKRFGNVNVAFSSEDVNFNRVPKTNEIALSEKPAYVHFTSNNTIFGTEFSAEPLSNGAPLVCDASSDFLSRPIDVDRYGLIYAGAQKNLGPAGVTIVVVKRSWIEQAGKSDVPTILKYATHLDTLFNTPPAFAVYMVGLVLEWLKEKGGLLGIQKQNEAKAGRLYTEIDSDEYYRGAAELDSRSRMNVTFRLPSEELEAKFNKEATAAGLSGLKGHRSVGGLRASIYNACPDESVDALIRFMQEFRKTNG